MITNFYTACDYKFWHSCLGLTILKWTNLIYIPCILILLNTGNFFTQIYTISELLLRKNIYHSNCICVPILCSEVRIFSSFSLKSSFFLASCRWQSSTDLSACSAISLILFASASFSKVVSRQETNFDDVCLSCSSNSDTVLFSDAIFTSAFLFSFSS